MKKWAAVRVTWHDAHGGDIAWGKIGKSHTLGEAVTTVGQLYSMDANTVVVALSVTEHNDVDCYVTIPRSTVVRVEQLR